MIRMRVAIEHGGLRLRLEDAESSVEKSYIVVQVFFFGSGLGLKGVFGPKPEPEKNCTTMYDFSTTLLDSQSILLAPFRKSKKIVSSFVGIIFL